MEEQRERTRRRIAAALAGGVAATLAVSLAVGAPASASTPTADPTREVTTEFLVDDSPAQQRWLSIPDSRVVLNPYYFDGTGSELEQTAGTSLPLHVGYYASDKAVHAKNLLQTFATNGERPQAASWRSALSQSFDDSVGWSETDVTTTSTSGTTALRLVDDKQWGHIERRVTVQNAADTRFLTVDVASLSTGTTWNVKVDAGFGDLPILQPDSAQTGTVTFDLAQAYGWEDGPKTLTVKLFAVNKTGASGGAATFRSLRLDNGADVPWATQDGAVLETFGASSADRWARAANSGASAGFATDGEQGTVTLGSSDFGAVERQFTVDLDETPLLSVRTAQTSGKWSLKLSTGSGADVPIQPDTSSTGLITYDLAGVTGWSGERTFTVKLFHVGKNGYTTFDDLAFHAGEVWLRSADEIGNEWWPEALESRGTYLDGTIKAVDVFHNADSFSRTVEATTNGTALAGAYEGNVTWDAAAALLTVEGELETYALALPAGADVRFGASVAELATGSGSEQPPSGSGAWVAALPGGPEASSVGVGFAVNDESVTADPVGASRERAQSAVQDPVGDRESWRGFWDEYLAKVPVVQDFSVQRVPDGGVTAEEMRHFWFKAWVNLEMNVLPATPETGNMHAQLGTGKPSLWMNGTPGTKNVASWDSLLGMQQLVYTDPENAWASFEGMMALVEDGPGATEPSDEKYGTRGELGGESLPSRKAQTAWILYSVTGERDRLEGIYDKLALHLNWERYNLRWVLHDHNHFDERDSEFVASLAYDLKFAIKIANELGKTDDADLYRSIITDLTHKYEQWFFPGTADAEGRTWPTVQKVYLDASRTAAPDAEISDGIPYRNEDGAWMHPGWAFYTSTAFVMDQLDEQSKQLLMQRFLAEYDEDAQLAGLGEFKVKAPDLQLVAYGLLDMDPIAGSTGAQLRDRAAVLVNAMNRDMVRSGWFAEVYTEAGAVGEDVAVSGVRPSLFGLSNYIDFVLMANGVRTDEGNPTFVRLADATGGVSGLTYRGQRLDIDLNGDRVVFAGPAAQGGCDAIDIVEGQSVTWAEDCGQTTPAVELDVQAQTRCLAGKAYVAVRATNTGDEPVDVHLVTSFGQRDIADVAPGASAYQSFAVRAKETTGGTASAVGTSPDGQTRSWDVSYTDTICG